MKITIHRGTHQIGGCITEITSGDTRIFIDFGRALPGEDGEIPEETISIPGLTEGKPRCDGVFFTHIHGDHIGGMDRLLDNIPLYMGEASKEIYTKLNETLQNASIDKTKILTALKRATIFRRGIPIPFGNLKITPFSVDHSSYDAYMFLIEAEGLKVLHTGDFRSHGFTGKGLLPTLEKYIGQVDWLICEGTMLSRPLEKVRSEWNIRNDARKLMQQHKKVFVFCSSMNIDRITAFVRGIPIWDRRPIVCDTFQKEVLSIVQRYSENYMKETKRAGKKSIYDFSNVYSYSSNLDEWMQAKGFLCFIRANRFSHFLLDKFGEDAVIVYSMWDGYLKGKTRKEDYAAILEGRNWKYLHTSGHASFETLQEVCQIVQPRKGIIPIHTEVPEKYPELFEGFSIQLLEDGKTFLL